MMLSPRRFVVLATISWLSAAAWASTPKDSAFNAHPPHGIAVSADSRIARNYPQTECLDFQRERKHIGFLCTSASKLFLADFGITTVEGTQDSPEHAQVATGVSSYEMAPIPLHGHRLFTAEVDCDEGDELQYRATSTCHVAFMPLTSTHFYYSSFVLRNHATSTSRIDVQAVLAIWESLTIPPGKQD
ncbi:hypothetical protein [Stenotrophomonas sp. 24(2023)]|uniref:hypothetical protein n=1 Tax=Stenotrophomonas sp. 24(2023) TaxID=3068324 RepID=UPI0027DEBE06|nr:hypothetical protein [Stenotrophomonas sp. 24(2023)]WMJ69559.1 hypothetical protein Q9R17_00145 [Stenotrophomonas sp. 24(2023)]